MINFLKLLLDLIYKNKCYFCSRSMDNIIFCNKCYNSITFLPFKPVEKILCSEIYSSCFYEKNVKKLIRAVKYHNKKDLAFYQAKLMFEYWNNLQNKKEKYLVIPVPMHKNRLKTRKFNHMDLVGEEFCKLTGYQLNTTFIKRIKDTLPQYKLSKKERENNLKNAFKICENKSTNLPILILDDITTTGSTIKEIIRELNKNGLTDITGFTTAIPENNSFYIY